MVVVLSHWLWDWFVMRQWVTDTKGLYSFTCQSSLFKKEAFPKHMSQKSERIPHVILTVTLWSDSYSHSTDEEMDI